MSAPERHLGYRDPAELPQHPITGEADLRYIAERQRTEHLRRVRWTAAELMATEFPPPRFAIPGIVPEGLSVLVGPAKLGKSWLMLNAAVAVATGGRAFGKVPVEQGEVLYLALEDNPSRLKDRLAVMLEGAPPPPGLDFAIERDRLHDGGIKAIDEHLDHYRDTRLVVVDVLARVRGTVARNEDRYAADYRCVADLKEVADRHQVGIVVVHHTRKERSEDFVESVSGTNGITGAADAVLVLRRSRGDADGTLEVTGRDVEESANALRFVGGRWTLLDGPATDYDLRDTRRRIVQLLRDAPGMTPKSIAEALGEDHDLVKQTVRRMLADDQLDTDGEGRYFPPVTPVTAVTEEVAE